MTTTDVKQIADQIGDDDEPEAPAADNGAAAPPQKTPARKTSGRKQGASAPKQPPASGIPKTSPLSKLVPGAERVRIEHREDDGHLAHCGDYGERDIASVGDVKSFIQRYHATRYGAGDYYLTYINAKGDEIDAGVVHIPRSRETGDRSTSDDLKELLREQERRDEKAKQEYKEMAQQMMQQNPFASVKEAAQAMHALQGGGEGKGGGGMDPMMMMMMMGQQQQQQMQMMMQMMNREPDSGSTKVMEKILERIDRLESEGAGANNMPPPPPPAPQTDPAESLSNAITKIAEVMRPPQPQKDPLDDVLKLKQLLGSDNDSDRMTTRDMMEMFKEWRREIQPDDGSDTFKSRMNELMMLMQFNQQMSGGQGGTFWDFAQNFLEKFPDNAEAFAQAADQVRAKQRQQEGARSRRRRVSSGDEDASPRRQQPQRQPAQQQQTQAQGDAKQLPESFKEYAQAMEDAQDDAELIEAGLHALNHLREFEQWQSIPNTILLHLHDGNLDQAFDVLDAFLEAIQSIDIISEQTVQQAQHAFREHVEQVLAAFGFDMPEDAEIPKMRSARNPEPEGEAGAGEGDDEPEGEPDEGEEDEGEAAPEEDRANGAS